MRILYISLFYLSVNAVYGQFHFAEKQSEAGIDHFVEHREFMGGGATFFDFDLDGDEDLYITSGFLRDHFYINNGDGTFTNEARERGFRDTDLFYTTGVIAGDIDNDGYKDLYVNTWRSNSQNFARNLLFHNNGDGTFTEIWEQSGGQDEAFTMGSVFIDYNLDGFLDENGIPNGFAHDCFSNSLYLNKGEGVFEKVIDQPTLDNAGCALAVTASDYDADGDLDIYLANDFGEFILPNSLFQNNEGEFTDVAEETGADIGIFGMGIAVGDIDMDLDLDYYVTNLGRNVLLQNEEGGFNDITTTAGVENSWVIQDALRTTGWGTAFLDFDNDMDLDLFVSNGVIPADEFIATSIPDPNKLYENDGTGNFTDVSAAANVENLTIGRGLATADYDNDGDVDVLNVVLRGTVDGQVGETILYQNHQKYMPMQEIVYS